MRSHDKAVRDQFDPQAQAYLTSAVHAAGPDLQHACQMVQAWAGSRAAMLDVGCGAGHLAFALASGFAQVVAADPSPAMLDTVKAAAVQRGLPQIEVRHAHAEALPFADGSFDLVCSRYSAHHWLDVPAALRQMRRVVRPGGQLLMIDILGDEIPLVDTHLQAIELLRDPSHVRDYSAQQWRVLLEQGGFGLQEEVGWPTRLEFGSWVARMRTPPEIVAAIRWLQKGAPKEVWDGLAMEPDGTFVPRTGLFWARAVHLPGIQAEPPADAAINPI
jgi:ubiquinone/menaquinone biosynthesis C-methylase UbiE